MNGLQSSSKTQNIAVFGLGEAGSLLAVDLLAAGNVVTGYDPKAVVTPFGIIRANSASDAVANADIIIALTAGDDALRST